VLEDGASAGIQATNFAPADYIRAASDWELATFETTTFVMRHSEGVPSLPFVGEEYLDIRARPKIVE
jgi:hypothetical protein